MVEAWLKMKDNVYDDHREPTWNSLAKGLKKANQMSLAKKITSMYEYLFIKIPTLNSLWVVL